MQEVVGSLSDGFIDVEREIDCIAYIDVRPFRWTGYSTLLSYRSIVIASEFLCTKRVEHFIYSYSTISDVLLLQIILRYISFRMCILNIHNSSFVFDMNLYAMVFVCTHVHSKFCLQKKKKTSDVGQYSVRQSTISKKMILFLK